MYHNADEGRRPGCAPSVLITFINMMLFKNANVPAGCSEYMFEGQDILQKVLLFSALACVPIMLFGKPLFITCSIKIETSGKTYVSIIYYFVCLIIIIHNIIISIIICANWEYLIFHFYLKYWENYLFRN